MKLNQFRENAESPAHQEAVAKGLTYKGFGYWADSQGNVVARTQGDKLIPTGGADHRSSDETENAAAPGKGAKQSYDAIVQAGMNPDIVMGEVLPGEEKAPKEDGNWTPGPDGDNMVDSGEETEIEDDVFVQKWTDSEKWVSGADGSNYKNLKSFDNVKEAVEQQLSLNIKKTPAELARDRGLDSDGRGGWVNNRGQLVARTEGEELIDLTPEEVKRHELGSRVPGRTTMRDMVKGKRPAEGLMKNRVQDAQQRMAGMDPEAREKYIDDKMRTKDGTYRAAADKNNYNKAVDGRDAIDRMSINDYESEERVAALNEASKEYYADPTYDLSENNRGRELGTGSFGSVYLSEDGQAVIKEGQIGRAELMILDRLKDLQGFPVLINAEFQTDFHTPEEQVEMGNLDSEEMMGDSFWGEQATAKGVFAMSIAEGVPMYDAYLSEVTHEAAAEQFWGKMAAMHKRGIAHNDLHGGNIFYNEDTGEITILDLGLATDDPMMALYEALGSQSGENYQLTSTMEKDYLTPETLERLEINRQNVIEKMSDDFSGEDVSDEQRDLLEEFVSGGIRMTQMEAGQFQDELGYDREDYMELLEMLYEGLGEEPEQDDSLPARMERGYNAMMDKMGKNAGYKSGDAMKGMFNAANDINREQGRGDIPFKGFDITRNPKPQQ